MRKRETGIITKGSPELETYCTTGQFAHLGAGFDRHCGPTAITNLVLTLEREARAENLRSGDPGPAPAGPYEKMEAANHTFLHIAKLGAKSHIYWNTSFRGHFGGTSDWLAGFFIRRSLKAQGLGRHSVKGLYLITEKNMLRELQKGNILYLMLHGNSKYKSHHMLCYGSKSENGKVLFRVADGWTRQPQYLAAKDLKHGLFYAVNRQRAD